jgi:hypothetical protein
MSQLIKTMFSYITPKVTPTVQVTPPPSELYEKYYGPQDDYFLNEKLYEFPLKESEYTKKENTHISTNYNYGTSGMKCNLDIDCDQDLYHFINNLRLRIYNPEKKPLRDIIESISLEIGGTRINSLDNLETMLSNYTHLNLVEPTRQVDDFLHVYLPFVNKQTLVYCQGGYHDIRFVLTFATRKPQFRLYGDAYTLKDESTLIQINKNSGEPTPHPYIIKPIIKTSPSYNRILSPVWKNISFMSQYACFYFNHNMRKTRNLCLNSPTHCIFINLFQEVDGKKIKSKGNLKNVTLVIDNETVFDGIPEKTGESEYIINFSNEFYKPHTSTVNFSMVQDVYIKVTTDSFGVQLDEFHAVSSNVLGYNSGMWGLHFGK